MGPPDDEDEDMDAPVWAGVMPLRSKNGALIRTPRCQRTFFQHPACSLKPGDRSEIARSPLAPGQRLPLGTSNA